MKTVLFIFLLSAFWGDRGFAETLENAHNVQPTRRLRRITLSVLGRPPTIQEYESFLAIQENQREAELQNRAATMMQSPEFSRHVREWGIEYLRTRDFKLGTSDTYWYATQAANLRICDKGSLHEGLWYTYHTRYAASAAATQKICNDASLPIADVEPWWAPGTTLKAVGEAAIQARFVDDMGLPTNDRSAHDCGRISLNALAAPLPNSRCGCGPNFIYCNSSDSQHADRRDQRPYDGNPFLEHTQRRSILEEGGRLMEHIVMNDLPFSDLVLGDYTIVNRGLFFMYRRFARNHKPQSKVFDEERWFDEFADRSEWKAVKFSEMSPFLSDDRTLQFDPRKTKSEINAIPSAGILTSISANSSFSRERVRAARWNETFACKVYEPPPASEKFNAYKRDPAVEGACQHCHTEIDPAAMYFKRFAENGASLGGIGRFRIKGFESGYGVSGLRFREAYIANTKMTPVSEAEIEYNPDSILIDFLPSDQTLFGLPGDPTIGPLGYGKMLVKSGKFDQCAVRKIYARFGPRTLNAGEDAALIQSLAEHFKNSNRNLRALIGEILRSEEMKFGY